MQFNPVDKSISIIADIDFLLFGDGSTFNTAYSLVDRTRNINISMDEVVSELFNADPNFMWDDTTNPDFPIATLDLEAGLDHYTLPDSTLVIHRVRVKDRNGHWYTLKPKTRRELSDDELGDTGDPDSYYKIDNAVFLAGVPNYGATGGIEIEFQRGANHFTTSDTTRAPGFNPQFHSQLSVSASHRYAIANGMREKADTLFNLKEMGRARIREHYEKRSPDATPRLRLARTSTRRFGL